MTTYREPWRSRGLSAWLLSFAILAFYTVLYFEDRFSVQPFTKAAAVLGLPNRWILYSAIYTAAMVGGAIYYLRRHGNNRYHRVRIAVNVAVQTLLAFALPYAMTVAKQPEYYLSILWPLKIEYLYPSTLEKLPFYLVVYSVIASLVAAPILAMFFGKRWYCSWVCGCGGLANTFGDPWRHLTSKSSGSWRFERWSVHLMLAIAIATTGLVVAAELRESAVLTSIASPVKSAYAFVVGAFLAGIVGVGVYPLLGPRVWCRNFCPMAAMMGLFQKLGRFRIRVKKDMCISCGNCSTYCEMGIDVRSYAQKNESFTRASCVGCGMCAHVCPRGVLRLEQLQEPRPGLKILDG